MMLILASQSASRRAMLDAAAVPHEAMSPGLDEDALKIGLRQEGISARNLADALAEAKALRISQRYPRDLVLGCDSTLAFDDGSMIDKAPDLETLKAQLRQLSGKTHSLFSAAVICEGGRPVWRHVDRAKMTMRPLSDAFIADYVDAEADDILWCVGGYKVEGRGAHLFSKIEGSQFTVMGLPLLPLLDYLRTRGLLMT